ncbi:hypothetical protein A1O3_05747 [Capronia epimyces CBS 606.96]|uniref:Uncharacterized protein n=1 Tax=Capronia epimyces CBS 606.96 TaxID=1182542 RepID=W9XWX6_9EURO|nr:uncharacterized protein A1O3_05747 [Capronia epimyces CBS 606.96]EXJ85072.1 hypothetical protein A1O3_05747 [Capronia epimyces CBS 606.96]
MSSSLPFNVSAELAALKHEKKNHDLHRLPPNATIRRRPLDHPSVPDVHVGARVPKVVYVSQRTPVISAVKRVKKMLGLIEKRAMQNAGATIRSKHKTAQLVQANDKIAKTREEVLVKASGRAIEQALRVGEWFQNKEKELLCTVVVRAGSVSVVDDIVEIDPEDKTVDEEHMGDIQEESKMECGDTTLELFGDVTTGTDEQQSTGHDESKAGQQVPSSGMATGDTPVKKTRRKKKRKRPMYKEDDLPEARLRWVKTVEVAISLQG